MKKKARFKSRTNDEIINFAKNLWIDDFFYDDAHKMKKLHPPEISVVQDKESVRLTLKAMYDSPELSYRKLKAVGEFFETNNLNDDDRFSFGGCETCDYGSSYGFTLTIRHPFEDKVSK